MSELRAQKCRVRHAVERRYSAAIPIKSDRFTARRLRPTLGECTALGQQLVRVLKINLDRSLTGQRCNPPAGFRSCETIDRRLFSDPPVCAAQPLLLPH
jgi:hypothetical protein